MPTWSDPDPRPQRGRLCARLPALCAAADTAAACVAGAGEVDLLGPFVRRQPALARVSSQRTGQGAAAQRLLLQSVAVAPDIAAASVVLRTLASAPAVAAQGDARAAALRALAAAWPALAAAGVDRAALALCSGARTPCAPTALVS
jgi:hypothetical protein